MRGLRPVDLSSSRSSTRDEYIEISASARPSNVRQSSGDDYIEVSDGKLTTSAEQLDSAYLQVDPSKPKVPSSPRPGLSLASHQMPPDLARSLSAKRHLPPPVPPPVLPNPNPEGEAPVGGLIRSATQSKRRAPPPPPLKKEPVCLLEADYCDRRNTHATSVCLKRMFSHTAKTELMSCGASDRALSFRAIGNGRTFQRLQYDCHSLASHVIYILHRGEGVRRT